MGPVGKNTEPKYSKQDNTETTKMGNMYHTKAINYKDGQHAYHQNN